MVARDRKKKRQESPAVPTVKEGRTEPNSAVGMDPEMPLREEQSAPGPAGAPQRKLTGFGTLILHLHPKIVPEDALALDRTFGLGGMATLLFVVLILTGALLLFVYEPSPERAYASVLALEGKVPFGAFVRAIHHWAACGLLVAAFLHLLRVFYTGAFFPPRRFNWVLGLCLLGLVVGSNFTGYLLPWDQLAFWAVTIGTGMLAYVPLVGEPLQVALRGGAEVGPKTLSIFFVLHIAILPILILLATAFHFWLVRKAGGVMLRQPEGQPGERRNLVAVRPHLVFREGVAALVLLAVLLLIASLFPAPLQEQANPGMSPNPAKAPWYFMGVQELLVHVHPLFAVFVVPLLALALLVAIPYVKLGEGPSGRWFHSVKGRRAAVAASLAALVVTPAYVIASESFLRWPKLLPFFPQWISNGLAPTLLWIALVAGVVWLARRLFGASRLEATQAAFTFVVVAFLVLTVTGIWFRGEGMHLVWPW